MQSGRTHVAVSAGLDALKAAESPDDVILAHAWLAQARDRQGEPVEAMRHARLALSGQRPLEPDTTVALLGILTHSPDREMALDAATALVDVHRELLRRHPDTPESLRDLSVSLNNVAGIQQRRGQLDEALAAYTESLTLRRRIRTTYGDTPEALRDLSVSLDKVAGIQQQRGQLDAAVDAYTEALRWYALLDERYGPPYADPDELAALRDAVASIPPKSSAR